VVSIPPKRQATEKRAVAAAASQGAEGVLRRGRSCDAGGFGHFLAIV